MSWEENKENTKSKAKGEKPLKPWEKNLIAGAICFCLGMSAPFAFFMSARNSTYESQQEMIRKAREENRSLKKQLETQKEKIVTVPVYITEPVKESTEAAPVTEISETVVFETSFPETEAPEDNDYQVKLLTNPLTKTQPYRSKPPAPAMYTVYWIDIKRSDLASLTASDFQFFTDYINEKYKSDDIVNFYIRITDYPDIIIDCPLNEYEKNTLFVCRSKYDDTAKCDVSSYIICEMNVSDTEQITLTGYGKDENKLPKKDESEVYSFSDFNEDLWSRLLKMKESADFLWN